MDVEIRQERISAAEYINFLNRTDLGSQYPKERFEERIKKLTSNVPISLIARNQERKIIGVCFAITDFAYWLFLTDLGVDRCYTGKGIGKRLVAAAMEAAGGTDDIIMYTCANENAIPFYEKIGMVPARDMMEYNHVQWTNFTVK
ncbi:MAG: GNAT family N-acetyltransferase [Clostridiales bacterium]|nr:GNAT family N-acetyltransferase [Clostridiales bacterium]